MYEAINYAWDEVTCKRAVDGTNFDKGLQDYITTIGPRIWIPSRSYFTMDATLEVCDVNGTFRQPTMLDDIAFAEAAPNMAYSQVQFLLGSSGVTTQSVFTQQISALHDRMHQTAAWMKSIGSTPFGYGSNRTDRAARISRWISATSGAARGAAPTTSDVFHYFAPDSTMISGVPYGIEQLDGACQYSSVLNAGTVSMPGDTNAATDAYKTVTGIATNFTKDLVGSLMIYAGADTPTLRQGQAIGTVESITSPTVLVLNAYSTGDNTILPVLAGSKVVFKKHTLATSDQSKNNVRFIFRPIASIFDYDGYLSGGEFKFWLTPVSTYMNTMVETGRNWRAVSNFNVPVTGEFRVNITNVRFYPCSALLVGKVPESIMKLDLWEFGVQARPQTSSTMTHNITVEPSTAAIHCFLQTNNVGNNPLIPPNRFKTTNGSELNIKAIQVTYGNKVNPSQRWSSSFNFSSASNLLSTGTNSLQQWYFQKLIETGKDKYFGGAESFSEWLERGPVFSFSFDRDFTDRATEVTVYVEYETTAANGSGTGAAQTNPDTNTLPFDTNTQFFIVSQYRKVVEVVSESGTFTRVRVNNA